MILFTLKKTFFDIWDHLFSIFFLNLGCVLVIGIGISAITLFSFHPVMVVLGIFIATGMLVLYIGAASMIVRDIADYKSPEFKKFFQYLKEVWKAALVFTLIIAIQVFIFVGDLPMYMRMGSTLGIIAAGVLFWISVIWALASQYYFPVRSRLDPDVRKILLKCLIIFFDNTPFTLVLGLGTLVMLILSTFTAFLLPGISSILLWHQVGLKLRLYKYNYLEEHPGVKKHNIPWHILLKDDQERVGKRTLRGMIFPWKE
jgi:uncharacterized membrane protein YesL